MNEIVMLPVTELHPHPDNPRKDLGDLQELADSIRANGVFQNLTVTPREAGGYTVVIGHRRLAAARLAGAEAVPCAVADMTPGEQIRTMLMENIQRSDLTPPEQAWGFQMMLDMGESVESIARESGFARSTIYSRLKIAKLPQDKVRSAQARGATLREYMELDKLEDPALKNRVLEAIGTANFNNEMKNALKTEADRKRLAQWDAEAAEFARKIEERGRVDGAEVGMEYITAYSTWNSNAQRVERPKDAGTTRYYYRVSADSLTIYRDERDGAKAEPSAEDRAHEEKREKMERQVEAAKETVRRHYALRRDFVRSFASVKQYAPEICAFAARVIMGDGAWRMNRVDAAAAADLLELETDGADYAGFTAEAMRAAEDQPTYALLVCAWAAVDREENGYAGLEWDAKEKLYRYSHRENGTLDAVYDFLESLGYGMSDEERAMRDGTHELLRME